MKTGTIVAIFAGLAAVAGGVWFFVLRKKSPAAPAVKPGAAPPPALAAKQLAPKAPAAAAAPKAPAAAAPKPAPKPIVAAAPPAPRKPAPKKGTFDTLWSIGSNLKGAAQSKAGRTILGFVPGGGAALSAIDTAEGVYGTLRG